MQLPDPLVEKLLGQRHRGRDREVDLAGAVHQVGFLPGPFIEDFAVRRMSGRDVAFFRFVRRQTRDREKQDA